MNISNERRLQEVVERVESRSISALEGARQAIQLGYYAIGTAASAEGYVPLPQMTARDGDKYFGEKWRLLNPDEKGQAKSIVRASSVPRTAVWAALGGDCNVRQQRQTIGKLLTPEDAFYHRGTFGWRFKAGNYKPIIHNDLKEVVERIPEGQKIGEIDFVLNDESFLEQIPDEPGHFGSPYLHERRATISIRNYDVRPLLAHAVVSYYDPLRR